MGKPQLFKAYNIRLRSACPLFTYQAVWNRLLGTPKYILMGFEKLKVRIESVGSKPFHRVEKLGSTYKV